jgi:hypothetical protein
MDFAFIVTDIFKTKTVFFSKHNEQIICLLRGFFLGLSYFYQFKIPNLLPSFGPRHKSPHDASLDPGSIRLAAVGKVYKHLRHIKPLLTRLKVFMPSFFISVNYALPVL